MVIYILIQILKINDILLLRLSEFLILYNIFYLKILIINITFLSIKKMIYLTILLNNI